MESGLSSTGEGYLSSLSVFSLLSVLDLGSVVTHV